MTLLHYSSLRWDFILFDMGFTLKGALDVCLGESYKGPGRKRRENRPRGRERDSGLVETLKIEPGRVREKSVLDWSGNCFSTKMES